MASSTPEGGGARRSAGSCPGQATLQATRRASRSESGGAGRRRIAIVPVIGTIAGGKSREDPSGRTRIAGAETVVRALARAQEDPLVKAIVVRVDSGGGDVLASDLMYRAVLEAKKPSRSSPRWETSRPPAATTWRWRGRHLRLPTTVTGSIGVFFLKPALRGGCGEKLGINQETSQRAPLADLPRSVAGRGPRRSRAAVQAWVDAELRRRSSPRWPRARKLDKAKVDSVARGAGVVRRGREGARAGRQAGRILEARGCGARAGSVPKPRRSSTSR